MTWLLIIVGLVGLSLLTLLAQKRWQRLSNLASGLMISYCTIMLILAIGEGYFRYVYVEASASPLAQRNWMERYWQRNQEEYRDRDWTAADFAGKQVIVAIGDSFTAGSGIKNPEDRFTSVLADLLGDDYVVVNRGIPGASTLAELESLKSFQITKPNIVIWQYFLNDIDYVALQTSNMPPDVTLPAIADESYLLNFLLYRLAHPKINPWQWYYNAYDNYLLWEMHRAEIDQMTAYIDEIGAELIVVIFPHLADPVASVAYVDRVEQAIQENGQHQIIKLFDDAAAWPEDVPITVSRYDFHASVAFNRHVAQRLYDEFFAE